ncbi:hypothetical protein TCAL_09612 [Tigriopus californicus]|uniref:Uncharacterized protein n=1 Tax=Tigriopus californicus TaxID=6832 RepID=A0A553P4M1_TIGCA|nr:hypothetical protein TCAL_09612 [Tigriopus californicus]
MNLVLQVFNTMGSGQNPVLGNNRRTAEKRIVLVDSSHPRESVRERFLPAYNSTTNFFTRGVFNAAMGVLVRIWRGTNRSDGPEPRIQQFQRHQNENIDHCKMENNDCVALVVALRYLQCRITGNVIDLGHLLDDNISDKCRQYLEEMAIKKEYKILAQNICTIRPQIGETSVALTLEYKINSSSPTITSEVIHVSPGGKIVDVEALDLKLEDTEQVKSWILSGTNLTPFDLFAVVVPFAVADANVDLEFHESVLDDNAEAYGFQGKAAILSAKQDFLGPQKGKGQAYKLGDFKLDEKEELMVSFRFQCLLPGQEAHGTEFVTLSGEKKVLKSKTSVDRTNYGVQKSYKREESDQTGGNVEDQHDRIGGSLRRSIQEIGLLSFGHFNIVNCGLGLFCFRVEKLGKGQGPRGGHHTSRNELGSVNAKTDIRRKNRSGDSGKATCHYRMNL